MNIEILLMLAMIGINTVGCIVTFYILFIKKDTGNRPRGRVKINIREGAIQKGGWNEAPTTERPSPPKGQG